MKKKVTLTQIAKVVGIGRSSVSLALRNAPNISPATCRKVQKVAKELGYEKDPMLSNMMRRIRKRRDSDFLSVNIAVLHHHRTVKDSILSCLEARANALNYNVVVLEYSKTKLSLKRFRKILETRNIQGVVLAGMNVWNDLEDEIAEHLSHMACVAIGGHSASVVQKYMPYVSIDHFQVADLATTHALKLGYRKPALVMSKQTDELLGQRFSSGYIRGLCSAESGNIQDPCIFDLVIQIDAKGDSYVSKENVSLFEVWFQREKPDVILSFRFGYDHLLGSFANLGISIPEDLGIINLHKESDVSDRQWAGVFQDFDWVASMAIDAIDRMLEHSETIGESRPFATLVPGRWIEGESVLSI